MVGPGRAFMSRASAGWRAQGNAPARIHCRQQRPLEASDLHHHHWPAVAFVISRPSVPTHPFDEENKTYDAAQDSHGRSFLGAIWGIPCTGMATVQGSQLSQAAICSRSIGPVPSTMPKPVMKMRLNSLATLRPCFRENSVSNTTLQS